MLHGESLSQVLKKRGRISAGRAVRTILPVIEALVVAHQRGIVHRDLKPDNSRVGENDHHQEADQQNTRAAARQEAGRGLEGSVRRQGRRIENTPAPVR
jgi:serine/threonine protein kinase